MKVLYLVTGIRPPKASGSEFIPNLIYEVSRHGIDVTVLSPIYIHTQKNMYGWAAEMEKKYNVRFILVDAPLFIKKRFLLHILLTPLLTTYAVLKLLFKERFDVVHEFSSTPIITFRFLIYKMFGAKSFFTLSVFNKTILGRIFWFRMFDFATLYLIPSKMLANNMIRMGINKEKVSYIPPGINIQSFVQKLSKKDARKKLSLPQDKVIFTYFGPLTEEKGVTDIIAAAKKLPKDIQDGSLIALFSVYLKDYSGYAAMANTIKSVTKTSTKLYDKFVDIPILLKASDYVIYPQRTGHGTTIPPISIIEALAAEKPIIASNIPTLNELIYKERGILFPPGDPLGLAKAITEAYLGNIKLQPKNEMQDFDLENVAIKLVGLYKKYEK